MSVTISSGFSSVSPSITAIVLTLNESHNIERCINSLRWCQEVIVVDSGSTDKTQDLAVKAGARIVVHETTGAFIITSQRNWALKNIKTKSEWILFLDADEEIGAACRREIICRLSAGEQVDGYEMTPRYLFLGRWLKRTQGYPNWHPRLLRNGRLSLQGGVWEEFEHGYKIGRITEPYEHHAFSKGIDDWLVRHIRYADWEAQKINQFVRNGSPGDLGTLRSIRMRMLSARLWPFRPVLRFSQKYILQLGFTEGWQGLLFAALMATYELITVVKIIQLRRLQRGLDL